MGKSVFEKNLFEEMVSDAAVNIPSDVILDWPNLTQRCKRFATTSTSAQVALLPWRYDAEMGTANSLHASA